MDIEHEIDEFFYGSFRYHHRRSGESVVRVGVGDRNDVPVRDWQFQRTEMDHDKIVAFARHFYNLGRADIDV